jgi:hypothetical protein
MKNLQADIEKGIFDTAKICKAVSVIASMKDDDLRQKAIEIASDELCFNVNDLEALVYAERKTMAECSLPLLSFRYRPDMGILFRKA